MYFSDFPIVGAETRLPIYLFTAGHNLFQYHVIRNEGYYHPQIIFCTKGSGTLIVDGTEHKINPNCGFFLPKGYPHEYYTNGDVWDTYWIAGGGDGFYDMLETMELTEPKVFKLGDVERLERILNRIHETLTADTIFGNYRASGLLYDFLIEFYRIISGEEEQSRPSAPLVRAIDHIGTHYPEKISMDELCDVSGVSKQHLCRLFRKSMNCRPTEYIAKVRIKAAKHELLTTDKAIETIAVETGFCTAGYFCKLFKRYEACTPGEYRSGLH